jgi:hypothetical protein
MPPKVRISDVSCVAYRECILDASSTIDSINDINDITIVWDLDITSDSNGDGISDNDADLIGKTVSHVFRVSGVTKIKAIAWDEDPERPGTSTKNIEISPPERNIVEKISASLVGEEANAFAQLSLLVIILSALALLSGRKKKIDPDMWPELSNFQDESDEFGQPIDHMARTIEAKRPGAAPPLHTFTAAMEIAPQGTIESQSQINDQQQENQTDPIVELNIDSPPIPEDGLPEGWSEDSGTILASNT